MPTIHDAIDTVAKSNPFKDGSVRADAYARALLDLFCAIESQVGTAAETLLVNRPLPEQVPTQATAVLPPFEVTRIPPSPAEPVFVPKIWWDPVLVMSDLHIPYHDATLIGRAVDKAVAEGCRGFIIAGDLTDNNQWHRRTEGIRTDRTWQEDIELAYRVLAAICERIPVGHIFFGNHDDWIAKATKGQMLIDWLYQHLFTGLDIHFSTHHQARVVHRDPILGDKAVRVIHGEHYSSTSPLGVAKAYAAKFGESVLMGHQHMAEEGAVGDHQAIVLGGLFDPRRQEYLHERPAKYPATQRGFAIIRHGRATLYRPEDTTW